MKQLKSFMQKNNYLATKVIVGAIIMLLVIIFIALSDNDNEKEKDTSEITDSTEDSTTVLDSQRNEDSSNENIELGNSDRIENNSSEIENSTGETSIQDNTDSVTEDETTTLVETEKDDSNSVQNESKEQNESSETNTQNYTENNTTEDTTTNQEIKTEETTEETTEEITTEEETTAPPRGANGVILEDLTIQYLTKDAYTIPDLQSQIFADNDLSQGDLFGVKQRFIGVTYAQEVFGNGILLYNSTLGTASTVEDIIDIYGQPMYRYFINENIEFILYKYKNIDYGYDENLYIRFEFSIDKKLIAVVAANMEAYVSGGNFNPN